MDAKDVKHLVFNPESGEMLVYMNVVRMNVSLPVERFDFPGLWKDKVELVLRGAYGFYPVKTKEGNWF
ncbi:MAG: hypothetical protein QHH15_00005, partial [Candidatus Thermoplasmatota archaeon]|nr:hypothetical protein [Candidatus Thermoplasmatota archaeon]